jgi:hypothetical protein
MTAELSFSELDLVEAELLPAREALGLWNWANVYANNSSLALNAATAFSTANSAAYQSVVVNQS